MDVDLRLVWLFMRELAVQGRHSLRAYNHLLRIDHQLQDLDPIRRPLEFSRVRDALNEEAFLYVHSFLTHAGNVSKILWPPKPLRDHTYSQDEREQRAEALRRILQISDHSPLKPRTFRDDLEHFDERLENWFRVHGTSVDVWDMNTFPFGLSNLASPSDDSSRLRTLMSAPYRYSFLDKELNLEEIANALGNLTDGVGLWLNLAGKAGLERARDTSTPTHCFIHRPNTEFSPGTEAAAHDRYFAAVETLRTVGVCQEHRAPTVECLSSYIRQRGWKWSVGPDSRGVFNVRLNQPETNTTYVTQGWSEYEGIIVALAALLHDELLENARPNMLRIDESGGCTFIRL